MTSKDKTNYFKLVALTVNIAYNVIWKYISERILDSLSFESFLNLKKEKHKLVHVYETKDCCECLSEKINGQRLISRKQLLLLYNSDETQQIKSHIKYIGGKMSQTCICNYSAIEKINVKIVDITLANHIIQQCGKHELGVTNWIEQIKDVRNEIFHLSDIQKLTDERFSRKWTKLEGSILGIAQLIDTHYAEQIKRNILQTKTLSFIPDYMLKYEILCRDYWKHKCAEFEQSKQFKNKLLIVIIMKIISDVQRIHIPVLLQLDLPESWDKHKIFEAVDEMRLKGTPDMNIRIKTILTDDLDIIAEMANTILRNVHELSSEIKKIMSSMLSEAEITTKRHDEVGFNLKIPDKIEIPGWPDLAEGIQIVEEKDIKICSLDFYNKKQDERKIVEIEIERLWRSLEEDKLKLPAAYVIESLKTNDQIEDYWRKVEEKKTTFPSTHTDALETLKYENKVYPMKSVNRGKFILISNVQVKPLCTKTQNEEKKAQRYADYLRNSDFDLVNVFQLFKFMGYDTTDGKQFGKTKEEIKEILKQKLNDIDKDSSSKYDSLIIVFLSSKIDPQATMIYDIDGEVVPKDEILEIIKGCQGFEGKPKIIIVHTYNFNEEKEYFDKTNSTPKGIIMEKKSNTDDIFVVSSYSRIGPWMIGDNMVGSYFIQALIHAFKNLAYQKSFMELLKEAHSCLIQAVVPEMTDGENSGTIVKRTVAEIVLLEFCERKTLYFFPGLTKL
ncbi:unnamed protein product [Mytilus coruscus]|uniref:Caspase family p20 domain-containing protein n=1 Tax=Mytilus coruscus TaxID=42192 RepID=A0A6J8CA91_MYTCO|nr:unnamed protein product [Mytilus coruscus]